MWQLELILLLRISKKALNLTEISRALYLSNETVLPCINRLVDQGIISKEKEDSYQFAPQTPELSNSIEAAAQAYAERRTAVIELIFYRPIQSFADAFILKSEED